LGVKRIPHPTKTIFDRYNTELWAIAKRIGRGYHSTWDLLNGRFPCTVEINAKLREAAKRVEEYPNGNKKAQGEGLPRRSKRPKAKNQEKGHRKHQTKGRFLTNTTKNERNIEFLMKNQMSVMLFTPFIGKRAFVGHIYVQSEHIKRRDSPGVPHRFRTCRSGATVFTKRLRRLQEWISH
jgi:hypothetical protein